MSERSHRYPEAVYTNEPRVSSTRPGPQYQPIEDVEDLERYFFGGYHPLQLGDQLSDSRYALIDKLGSGGYSTIWLARDLRSAKYVAVKVIAADASSSAREATLIRYLGSSPAGPGREIVPPLMDEFCVSGPNGEHRCIVTFPPFPRMSLFDAKEASKFGIFQPKVAQSIIAQLIRGVSVFHTQSIVHGDLHLGNVLVKSPKPIDNLSTSELYERFGDPESEAVVRIDGKSLSSGVPSQLVLYEERIVLSDFDESLKPREEPRYSSKTLPLLQPPEAWFSDEPLSFASDVWTLGCTIWEIFGQRPLFETFFPMHDRVTMEQTTRRAI
ncbi:kinase-like protein [Aspergillus heteromorphus CBS 117.55]|uniref:non-specific serine/threonine protein kinase n=1 Tax=Aspergillus heteromorphus CBS 117.55 TaxID=1448321 RepID=A0A317VZ80_9EURO|nr:kinase-like protein [Aspergillus heteromorphus CBS 117.55]PWY78238.1 kinase-like protein [Aspergillus heteromorphus CBS 117.55]